MLYRKVMQRHGQKDTQVPKREVGFTPDDNRPRDSVPRKISDPQEFQPDWLNRLLFGFDLIVVVNFHKVAAVDSRLIGQVDDNRKITKVGRAVRIRRKEDVGVFGLEGLLSRSIDGRVLPTEVANFARLGHGDIAGRFLATAVRVKVSTSGVAVAIFGHWSGMDVIR